MVDFCGWSLPVTYDHSLTLRESTIHTRTPGKASLFDVSHMGQILLRGKDRGELVARASVCDVNKLDEYSGTLSVLLNRRKGGGIIDDAIINRHPDYLYMVVNGGNRDKDLEHLKECAVGLDVSITMLEREGLVALQGPASADIVAQHAAEVPPTFMRSVVTTWDGKFPVIITRCGYTGEDGFEISADEANIEAVATSLVDAHPDAVALAGLGARDALRIEAGLCLYGHELSEEVGVVDAGLKWTVQTTETTPLRDTGVRRAGFVIGSGAIARGGEPIVCLESGEQVGNVTSGTYSPCTGQSIGMGYLKRPHNKRGTAVGITIRRKQHEALITKMPFVETRYKMK
jgi:aminomethyltransferase